MDIINNKNIPITSNLSAVKTPGGSNRWLQMSGNNIVLQPGIWKITASCQFQNSGVTPQYSSCYILLSETNGTDSGTAQNPLASGPNFDIFEDPSSSGHLDSDSLTGATALFTQQLMRVINETTVYAVPYVSGGAIGNARVRTTIFAMRLRDEL